MKDKPYTTLDAVAPPAGSSHGKVTVELSEPASMPPTYKVRPGGLMRCCLQSLAEEMVRRTAAEEPLAAEGDVLPCRYHADKAEPVMTCLDGC